MINRVKSKYLYWKTIWDLRKANKEICKGRQVRLYNWPLPFEQDLWLCDFIEKRNLLRDRPDVHIGLYSIFAPMKLSFFDRCDARIFVARENLHKPSMQAWLHQFLDDSRIDLSIGFDHIEHPQYLRYPFWQMWSVFSPTDQYDDILRKVNLMNSPDNHSYDNRKFCSYICSHDDYGRRQIYEQLNGISHVDCDGKLFHNNDELHLKYGNQKMEFLKQYKFNLTPENTNYEGYVTEKLFEAIYGGCIPIYQGSNNNPEPDVLNKDAIIFIELGAPNTNALNLITELNNDKSKYLEFANQPRFKDGAAEIIWGNYCSLEKKIKEIIANI